MISRLFLNDRFILLLIAVNAVTIFFLGFDFPAPYPFLFHLLDAIITALFIIELLVKFKQFGIREFFKSNWNSFDFVLIVLSIPALISFLLGLHLSNISFLLIFRVLRAFKSFRFIRFIPEIDDLILGVQRALKASIIVIMSIVIYLFTTGIFSFYIFHSYAPEYFGNPIISLYSTFKIFTIEGWYEIPEQITNGLTPGRTFFTYAYFIFILLTGGIFGLSLVNSIFVDAMVADNNDDLEEKIDRLEAKITEFINRNQ